MNKSGRQVQQKKIADASLESKTQLYWQIAVARRGKGPLAGSTTESAIGLLSDLELCTSWETPLGQQVTDMLDTVIGRPKRKRTKNSKPQKALFKISKTYDDDWDGPSAA